MCIGVIAMNRDVLIDEMKKIFDECLSIVDKKNKDYANDTDPFLNLRTCESFGIADTETGMLVRMTDKFTRICNLIHKDPDVADEKIDDTIKDLINYLSLLLIYIKTKDDNKKTTRCIVCGKKLSDKELFYRKSYYSSYGIPPERGYMCDECDRYDIGEHENTVVRCAVCGKELTNRDLFYGNAYSLLRGEPPKEVYVCTTCDYPKDDSSK